MSLDHHEKVVELTLETAPLTLGNVQVEIKRILDYAQSKGAPHDARIEFRESQRYLPEANALRMTGSPPARAHVAQVLWLEDSDA